MTQSGQEGGSADSAQQGQQNNSTGTDSAQGTGNGTGGSSADSAQQNDSSSAEKDNAVSRAEFERLKNQLSAADQKRSQAEAELQELKDKDLSEKDKAVKDLKAVTDERDSLLSTVNELRLANAFLSANKVTWNDGDVALSIAQAKGYLADAVNDKGEVNAKELEKALDKLAADHKYLVKVTGDEDDEEEETPASGAPASGAGRKKQDDQVRADRIKSQLPALGRR
jgi:hypothetical protein